jgi:thiamine-phosphate pyrophosphorylase
LCANPSNLIRVMPAKGLGCGLEKASLSVFRRPSRRSAAIVQPVDLRLYAVLDPARTRSRPLRDMAAAAAAGGATLLQLRIKHAATRDLVAAAREVLAALAGSGIPLIINDRLDVALAVNADGVHVGQEDMAPADARRLLGPDAILGVTIHHPQEAAAIPAGIASYAGLGPVFGTASKSVEDAPLGAPGLHGLIQATRLRHPGLPCCGIAGVDHRNAPAVIGAGADGVAVISDIFMAEDVMAATARLRDVVNRALAARSDR